MSSPTSKLSKLPPLLLQRTRASNAPTRLLFARLARQRLRSSEKAVRQGARDARSRSIEVLVTPWRRDVPSVRRAAGRQSNLDPLLVGKRERVLLLKTRHLLNRVVEDRSHRSAKRHEPIPKVLRLHPAGCRHLLRPTLPCSRSTLPWSAVPAGRRLPQPAISLHP